MTLAQVKHAQHNKLMCMRLTFVALVISSVNGRPAKPLESIFLNCVLLGNRGLVIITERLSFLLRSGGKVSLEWGHLHLMALS